jgi:adenylate cyclase
VDCSLLFADVRGSTTLAEGMRPSEFRALMGRFYDEAFAALIDFNAIVDKFVGDEVIGIFIPAYSGQEHARHALDAALRLLQVTGHDRRDGPWIPIGIGVHSGVAFVGSVGQGPDTELTAMGDAVNVAARLASAAGAGEILVTAEAAAAAEDMARRERRSLQLKGKSEPTDVVVVTAGNADRDRY